MRLTTLQVPFRLHKQARLIEDHAIAFVDYLKRHPESELGEREFAEWVRAEKDARDQRKEAEDQARAEWKERERQRKVSVREVAAERGITVEEVEQQEEYAPEPKPRRQRNDPMFNWPGFLDAHKLANSQRVIKNEEEYDWAGVPAVSIPVALLLCMLMCNQEYKALYIASKKFQADIRATDKKEDVAGASTVDERKVDVLRQLSFNVEQLTRATLLAAGLDPDDQEEAVPEEVMKYFGPS